MIKRIVQIVGAVAALIIIVVLARSVVSDSLVTEIIRYGTLEDSLSVQGVLIKNETLYTPGETGVFEPQVREGARVSKGMKIGSVYRGEVDPALKKQLNQVNRRIETLKDSAVQSQTFSNDIATLDSDINKKLDELIVSASQHKMTKVSQLKTSIAMLTAHKASVKGEAVEPVETLDDLNAQKEELENQLGTVRSDMYAKESGVFSAYLDGFEGEITPARITELRPGDLKKYQNAEARAPSSAQPGMPVCKIVDNFTYYVAAEVDARQASDIKTGDSLSLRFTELSTAEVSGRVEYLSPEQGGLVVLVVSTSKQVEDIFSKRKAAVDIIKSQHKGLKVPLSAVRTQDGQTGVYAVRESVMRFIPLQIEYNNDEYAIVQEVALDNSALKLYDEVVLRADSYEDGKLVR